MSTAFYVRSLQVDEVASSYEAELRENLMIQNDIHTNNLVKSLQTQVCVFYVHSCSMEGVCLSYPVSLAGRRTRGHVGT